MTLQERIKDHILLLDGAMGTMIQGYGLKEADFRTGDYANLPGLQAGNNDILSLTRPDIIEDIHRRYLEAGADIIETNTFNAQRISQADYGCCDLVGRLNKESARLARRIADRFTHKTSQKRFVVGSIGPTNKTCSISPDVNDPAYRSLSFDELADAYEEQMSALIEGGVDGLLIETIFDTLNAKAAIFAATQAMEKAGTSLPLMLSLTIADKSGRTLSGQTVEAFLASISEAPVFSVGLNCSFGASDLKPFLEVVAKNTPCYVSFYPNAGLPNALGQYDQTPQEMANEMKYFLDNRLVNIIGGCCGTTDAFIAQFRQLITASESIGKPRKPNTEDGNCLLSGLDVLRISPHSNFINIGERCNVAGSRKFLRLIKEKNYDESIEIARRQVEDGAQVLDINMDDGLLDAKQEMCHFLNLLAAEPDVAKVPFMVDSSKWEVLEAALKCIQGKCIVNSISLKEGEETFLRHAEFIKRMGAAVIVMAFDESGQATSYERRIEICSRAYRLLIDKVHFNPNDIIFDPNVLSICTGMKEHNAYAIDFIRAASWIRKNLPGSHISGGVSNLSFSFRGNNYLREAMHAVFLYHAIKEGMDMGIVNPSSSVMYNEIDKPLLKVIEDAILNRYEGASDKLIETAEKMHAEKSSQTTSNNAHKDSWRDEVLEKRLQYALVKGTGEYLEEDLKEALGKYPHAVNIIEGPLMDAMNIVGDLFGSGKMFLPQVVKTARTMKKAVAILQPYVEAEKVEGKSSMGTAVFATVKGDVHDIGKNIVAVVLQCNNFEVVNLGVMTPAEKIVEEAKAHKADFIGLSGLITPSLDEMINTARVMKENGIDIPILLGGATTSELHTALKIAPEYDGPVIWVKDASQMVLVASAIMNPLTRPTFLKEHQERQARLCKDYLTKAPSSTTVSIQKARENKLNLFD